MLPRSSSARCSGAVFLGLALALAAATAAPPPNSGPWDLIRLRQPPPASWGTRSNLVQEVYYEGEPFAGHPTRVFAYYAQPAAGRGPFPAMVLVHGGGGRAFPDWATHWAERGYAALAMDTAGCGPNGRLADGGPDQSDDTKFLDFTPDEVRDRWTYHAIAAVIRGHSWLLSRPDVDARRTGITGISWGGYLTCIAAGVDHRFKVAVPVYGCGFLHENSCWLEPRFLSMSPAHRERWVRSFDPSQYLAGVRCPVLFLNGTADFAYPLDSYQKSYQLVRSPRTLSVQVDLPHGHIWTFGEVDAFVDAVLRHRPPLPRLSTLRIDGEWASARVKSERPIREATLAYTTDTGPWSKRSWKTIPAERRGREVRAMIPSGRPWVGYIAVKDDRGLTVSTPHVTLPE